MKIRAKREQPAKKLLQEVAARLFAKEGYDSVSIMDICNEAKVNSSMVSYYFGGKMELYESIADSIIDKQHEYIDQLIRVEDFKKLSIDKKFDELIIVLDKLLVFVCSEISSDMIILLLREEQHPQSHQDYLARVPLIVYLKDLMSKITLSSSEIAEGSSAMKSVIFQIMSMLAMMTSPRIFSTLLGSLLGHDEMTQEDIEMVRENLKIYVYAIRDRLNKMSSEF